MGPDQTYRKPPRDPSPLEPLREPDSIHHHALVSAIESAGGQRWCLRGQHRAENTAEQHGPPELQKECTCSSRPRSRSLWTLAFVCQASFHSWNFAHDEMASSWEMLKASGSRRNCCRRRSGSGRS